MIWYDEYRERKIIRLLFPNKIVFQKHDDQKNIWKKSFDKCSVDDQCDIIRYYQHISKIHNYSNYYVPLLLQRAKLEVQILML